MTDDELMARVRLGDIAAFETLVSRYEKAMVHYCAVRLRSDYHAAEDIAQEAFLKLLNGRYEPRSTFRGWLYRIASNLIVDHLRKSRAVPLPDAEAGSIDPLWLGEHPEVTRSPDQIISDAERKMTVDKALATLGGRHRAVIELKFVHGLKGPEIAEALGVNEGTVRSRIHTALSLLRVRLKGLGTED